MECQRRIDADATVDVLDRIVAARGRAPGMLAPARFARSWREDPENARPITQGAPADGLSTPQDAPTPNDINEEKPDLVPAATETTPGTTLHTNTNHRLSEQVDR